MCVGCMGGMGVLRELWGMGVCVSCGVWVGVFELWGMCLCLCELCVCVWEGVVCVC